MGWSFVLLVVLRPFLAAVALGGAVAPPVDPLGPLQVVTAAAVRPSGPERLTIPASEARSEWFQVHRASDADAEPVAVVRMVRVEAADHTLLERDLVWRQAGWRVHHTERLAGHTRRLTWREQGPGRSQAWTADWDLADRSGGRSAAIVGHGWARPTHERTRAEAPWIGALEWLEAARAGAHADLGPVAWLRPTHASNGVATVADDVHPGERTPCDALEAIGPEGRAVFVAGALVSFDLGSRELVATPIVEAEYHRLAGLWASRPVARHPFVEAALRRDQTLQRLAELGSSAIYWSQ